jgi:hypothetical protein
MRYRSGPSSAEVESELSYTSTSPLHLNGHLELYLPELGIFCWKCWLYVNRKLTQPV